MKKNDSEPKKAKSAATESKSKSRKPRRPPIVLLGLTLVYSVFLGTLTAINAAGPDQWVLGSFNMYLPQWPYALPGLILLPLFLWRARRWAWLPLLCLLWAFGPIMGFCWRWTSPTADLTKGTRLRLMTYNVKMGRWDMDAIAADVKKFDPDIVLCQEANGNFRNSVNTFFAGWNIQWGDQYLIASRRYSLTQSEVKNMTFGNWGRPVLRCQTLVGGQTVTLYSAHLQSPRGGIVPMLRSLRHPNQKAQDKDAEDSLIFNTDLRLAQAHLLAGFLKEETTPAILAGDLNTPVQSQACQQLFNAGLRDAFSEAGRGYGYSYGQKVRHARFAYVRIDHILVSKEWQVLDCQVGNNEGSEHRPVIADLYLPNLPGKSN